MPMHTSSLQVIISTCHEDVRNKEKNDKRTAVAVRFHIELA